MDWIAIICVAGSALAVLLAVRIAFSPTENRVGAWTLAGFLWSAAMIVLDTTFYRQNWFAQLPGFYGIANPFIVASGPLFYLYACAATDPAFRWRWTKWLHFVPSVLFAAVDLPLFFLSADEKIELAQQDIVRGSFVERLASVGLIDAYLLTYFVLAWSHFWRRRERIEESREEGRSHPLRGIGLFATVLVLVNVVSAVLDFTPWVQAGTTVVALAAVLGVFAVFWTFTDPTPLIRRHVPSPAAARLTAAEPTSPTPAPASTAGLPVPAATQPEDANVGPGDDAPPDEETQRLAGKLTRLMESERPYLDPALSLHALAEQLGTTRHRASLAIKCAYGARFYQVVAGYRVRAAAIVLRSEDGRRRTIADIAFASGFNTLSAFNTAFRTEFNTTPKGYRDQVGQPGSSDARPRA